MATMCVCVPIPWSLSKRIASVFSTRPFVDIIYFIMVKRLHRLHRHQHHHHRRRHQVVIVGYPIISAPLIYGDHDKTIHT